MEMPSAPDNTGWWDELMAGLWQKRVPPPPSPQPPEVDGSPQGVPISTQSGPYNNSYTKGQVPSGTAWLNTFGPE